VSEQNRDDAPRYTGWQVAVIVLGTFMLLPGMCALVFVVGTTFNTLSKRESFQLGDPIMQMIMVVWAISFAITAAGVLLIRGARRRARAAR
jgi:hypothetical protein